MRTAVATCPMCREVGVHPSVDDCLVALRDARARFQASSPNACRIAIHRYGRVYRRVQRWLVGARGRGMQW